MANSIQDIYEAVKAQETEKVAAAEGATESDLDFKFTPEFFDNLGTEDPETVEKLGHFIDAARGEGIGDEEIEARLEQIEAEVRGQTKEAGAEEVAEEVEGDGEEVDYDMAKEAAAWQGAGRALEDYIEKAAGAVTLEDIQAFDLGEIEGASYYQTMQSLEQMGEKIASAKTASQTQNVGGAIDVLEAQGFDVSGLRKQAGIEEEPQAGNEEVEAAIATLREAGLLEED
jgi:hypothetical protein